MSNETKTAWLCKKCGEPNMSTNRICKKCGSVN